MLFFLEVYVEFFLGNYLTFENLKTQEELKG